MPSAIPPSSSRRPASGSGTKSPPPRPPGAKSPPPKPLSSGNKSPPPRPLSSGAKSPALGKSRPPRTPHGSPPGTAAAAAPGAAALSKPSDVEAVVVAVRMRPFNTRETDDGSVRVIRMKKEAQGSHTWVRKPDGKEKEYEFDYSWQTHSKTDTSGIGNYVTQDEVFQTLGVPVLNDALEGRNVCLFAYGQTGSGKTYSMVGKEKSTELEEQGIIPRACTELFSRRERDKGNPLVECSIDVRVIEIYMDKVNDLLAPKATWPKQGHKLRFLGDKQGYTVDSMTVVCESYDDMQRAFDAANKNRSVGSHALNEYSSRAHTIYTITYRRTERASADATDATTITSRINLIDLAGSERTEKAQTSGIRFQEGTAINLSLQTLGRCIKVLSEAKGHLVPFNESILTRLLQGSMVNGRVVMIAAISPSNSSTDESISTLEFAKRIKQVRIRCDRNVSVNPLDELRRQKDVMEQEMQAEISRLKKILEQQGLSPDSDKFLTDVESAAAERRKLQEERDQIKAELLEERERRQQLEKDFEELRVATAAGGQNGSPPSRLGGRTSSQELTTKGGSLALDHAPEEPHLSNLNPDARLNGRLIFALRDGENVVGAGEGASVPMEGTGVQDDHCCIKCTELPEGGYEIKLAQVSRGARVTVNGVMQKEGASSINLYHNTRLMFADEGNLFVLRNPGGKAEADLSDVEVTHGLALAELDALEELRLQKEAAVAAGDYEKADSLKKAMDAFHRSPTKPSREELEERRKAAVEREDYEEAARITKEMNSAPGASVLELEGQKRKAIANEDYEEASRLSNLIRSRTHGSWKGQRPVSSPATPGSGDDYTTPLRRAGTLATMRSPAAVARDESLPQRFFEPEEKMGREGSTPLSARPDLLPMTARTQMEYKAKRMFVATASVSLGFLVTGNQPSKLMTLPLDVAVNMESSRVPTHLVVNIYQMTPADQPPSQKRPGIGDRMDFVVHVIGGQGIPDAFSSTVYCKYVFKFNERDTYKTPEVRNTTQPNFDYKKRFAFPKMTRELMDWFQRDSILTFELIGIRSHV
eukprot:Hpha_TRINITY_DN16778_c3_g2::TRINITY_DN16778_c3_g2_i1::g.77533::m.77533